jgi:hypothetical protein
MLQFSMDFVGFFFCTQIHVLANCMPNFMKVILHQESCVQSFMEFVCSIFEIYKKFGKNWFGPCKVS